MYLTAGSYFTRKRKATKYYAGLSEIKISMKEIEFFFLPAILAYPQHLNWFGHQ